MERFTRFANFRRLNRAASAAGVRGFTLLELLLVIAIIGLLVTLLLPALGKSRKLARQLVCETNMRQYGTGMQNYCTDAKNFVPTFSWFANKSYSQYADLNNPTSQTAAHAYQAVDIVRRITSNPAFARFDDRMMNRNFSQLVLVDGGYYSERLPEPGVACPEDKDTLIWQKYQGNPAGAIAAIGYDPDPGSSAAYKFMLPYWSSYQLVPNTWSPESGPGLIYQAPTDFRLYVTFPALTKARNRRIDEVSFPSQKVALFDLYDRHKYKRTIFYAYKEAAQPLTFFDGSVTLRKTKDSNEGWNPQLGVNSGPTTYTYNPRAGEPAPLYGNISDSVKGHYRWTRQGLRGVDFGGREVR